jgi:hypothetical protein
MSLFTSSAATFAGDNLPTDTSDWIGYAKLYGSTKEFMIRNLSDVTATDQVVGGGIELISSPFLLNFDDLANGLPTGVSVKISSTSTSAGADATFTTSPTSWNNTSSGFKNYASATTLTASSDAVAQNSCTNRALGVKQTSATGYDPGAAFLFHISNTISKTNLSLHFLLQSLDESAGRTTTWEVQYALGENPTSFIPVTTSPILLSTGPVFQSLPVTANFGNALDNQAGAVWIRIVTLSASGGSGSRASTAIDDVEISWN